MSPQRIQRKRTKGWRKPEGAVYVGRGSRWGNPWVPARFMLLTGKRAGEWIDEKDAVRMFRNTLKIALQGKPEVREALAELRGKDLMCWCPPGSPCHADVLLKFANDDKTASAALSARVTPAIALETTYRKRTTS